MNSLSWVIHYCKLTWVSKLRMMVSASLSAIVTGLASALVSTSNGDLLFSVADDAADQVMVCAACACTWRICEGCAMNSFVRHVQHTQSSLVHGIGHSQTTDLKYLRVTSAAASANWCARSM